jgi:hypothetical protein
MSDKIENIIEAIVVLVTVYLMIDFFFWNGGILNPAILPRIADVAGMVAPIL